MAKIINFQEYLDKNKREIAKLISKADKVEHVNKKLSKTEVANLKRLSSAILSGNNKEIESIIKKRNWSLSLSWNPVEYGVDSRYAMALDLDPYTFSVDLLFSSGETIDDCLLDLADGILEYIGR